MTTETPTSVCSRCGAHIQRVFTVGGLHFGSECIAKVDESLLARIYGERLELGKAIHLFAARHMKSRARGVSRDLAIDVDAVPKVGALVRFKTATGRYEVVGYSRHGIRLKGCYQGREFYNDAPFDKAADLVPIDC